MICSCTEGGIYIYLLIRVRWLSKRNLSHLVRSTGSNVKLDRPQRGRGLIGLCKLKKCIQCYIPLCLGVFKNCTYCLYYCLSSDYH